MNNPYVKKYNGDGLLLNPITKDYPYENLYSSNRGKSKTFRTVNNRKPVNERSKISRLMFIQRLPNSNRPLFHRNKNFS